MTAEFCIDCFQATDQIKHLSPRYGTTRCGAKVRTTTKGPVCIDQATTRGGVEQGTTAIGIYRQLLAARRFPSAGGNEGFAFGEIRR